MKYHISRGGQQFGPYSLEDLKKYLAQGNVLPTDLAWAEGMAGWVPVSQVAGPPQPAAPAAPAPPAAFQAPTPAPMPAFQPAAPAFQAPVSAGYSQAGSAAYPAPPAMQWVLVVVLAIVTCGLFPLIWLFIQAGFVKKIDRECKAMPMLIAGLIAVPVILLVQTLVTAALIHSGGREMMMIVPFLSMFVGFLPSIFFLIGIFRMRKSLVDHYTRVEPINLRLSGAMTFFCNVYYFQYHMARIANWKKTGVLA
jgi:hypothetical protein